MECEICGNSLNSTIFLNRSALNCNFCKYNKTVENEKNSKELKEKYKSDFWSQEKLEDMILTNFSNKQGRDYKLAQESMYEYCRKFIPSQGRILEIGVGTGVHLINFDKLGYQVTGIEPDLLSTEFLNKTLKNGKCINGYIEDLDFEKKFDVVFLYHVVEHLEHPLLMLKKCKDLLKNDGIIIIAVPDCENPETLEKSVTNPFHIWHFSKKSFEILGEKLKMHSLSLESFTRVSTNSRRIHLILRKANLSFITRKNNPHFPLTPTDKNNGYEIRLVLKNKF
jgi:2-polyprenyl-3-methyl-5-hydroxy-6-metoxy-1,4-benzoquinol methylase